MTKSKEKELKKASFIRRLCAFIIDMVLISFAASLIAIPFTNTTAVDSINTREKELREKYTKQEINSEEYLITYTDIYYDLNKNTGIASFTSLVLSILYFVVFQLYNKGQTLGKKLLGIKIVSDEKELNMNQMIVRSLLANFILVNILKFALLTFTSKSVYVTSSGILELINYIVILVSVIMATTKEGRTIHDRIAHTRVVKAK